MSQSLATPHGNITIRSAAVQDAEKLLNLRLEALAAHPEAFAADVEMTKNKGRQAWADQVNTNLQEESGVIIIANAGDKLVGMAGVGRGHWPKTRHSAMVWGVYVSNAWRGLRIAEAMLEECIKWAAEHGIVVLKLGVVTNNTAAIRCYERSGFKIYGTEPKTIQIDGNYYDEYLMARSVKE